MGECASVGDVNQIRETADLAIAHNADPAGIPSDQRLCDTKTGNVREATELSTADAANCAGIPVDQRACIERKVALQPDLLAQWTYGDTSGIVARLNPLSWSGELLEDEMIQQLENRRVGNRTRPVRVNINRRYYFCSNVAEVRALFQISREAYHLHQAFHSAKRAEQAFDFICKTKRTSDVLEFSFSHASDNG